MPRTSLDYYVDPNSGIHSCMANALWIEPSLNSRGKNHWNHFNKFPSPTNVFQNKLHLNLKKSEVRLSFEVFAR